jgi:hypothetical protein
MNRNDQNTIGSLYTEAVLQGASGKKHDTGLMALRKMLELRPDSAIAQIKAEIGAPGGMLYADFQELAIDAFREAGITTGNNLTWNKLSKAIGDVLEAEIEYNKGYDDQGYVFADVGYEYGQDIVSVPKQ